jgi:hypothetical protein
LQNGDDLLANPPRFKLILGMVLAAMMVLLYAEFGCSGRFF